LIILFLHPVILFQSLLFVGSLERVEKGVTRFNSRNIHPKYACITLVRTAFLQYNDLQNRFLITILGANPTKKQSHFFRTLYILYVKKYAIIHAFIKPVFIFNFHLQLTPCYVAIRGPQVLPYAFSRIGIFTFFSIFCLLFAYRKN
jgi:hypothetical protein